MTQSNNESNYLQCYGLSSAPFRLSPDPEFFFPSNTHIAAKEVLKYAIKNNEGFMVLSGRAGSGKTLLLRLLLNEMDEDKHSVLIINPVLTPAALLHQILLELDFTLDTATDETALMAAFQKILLSLAAKNKDLLIIIDEAQNMPLATLEYLRMLSNIETNRKKLLQILLTGQPELDILLEDEKLAQLSQRIVVHEKLRPLSANETVEYVNYRLAKAGRGDIGLTWFAKRALYNLTDGIPRLVNRLMDRTLLMACSDYDKKLSRKHILCAEATLPKGYKKKKLFRLFSSFSYAVLFCSIITVLII
jgi:general secretion pathway protein A